MEAPPGGCLDNRNRGQGLFRWRGLCFLHHSLPLGAGRRKGLDVAEPGPAGAAQTPPPSPRAEPWRPIHPARANPRPNIPLRSVPASSPPLQYQVSACILTQALALLHHFWPWPLVPSEGGGVRVWGVVLHPLCRGTPRSRSQGQLAWEVMWGERWGGGFYVRDAILVTGSGHGCGCSKRCVCTRVNVWMC